MWNSMFSSLFACRHEHTSFPLTPKGAAKAARSGTYVSCLDCGQELAYDWATMQIGEPLNRTLPAPVSASVPLNAHR